MHFKKRILSVMLCIAIIALTCFASVPVSAETLPQYGLVAVSDWLIVRSGPNTTYAEVGKLYPGDKVKILDKVNSSNTNYPQWYKISVDGKSQFEGKYVAVNFIDPIYEYIPEAEFEQYLKNQGFPESYKPLLRTLHATYPKWVFVADHLNHTWEFALNTESKVGTSLIQTPNSWKSMEYGAYNWDSKSWVVFDTGGWVAADKNVVAYYLDPRNSLNSTAIFQFLQQSYDASNQNINGLRDLVSGTFLANSFPESSYSTYCDVLIEAAKQSGVNPYILASMILNEQGVNGTGKSISGTVSGYEGYYNFYNINAYEGGGKDAVQNGLAFAKGSGKYNLPWNTRAKAIIGGAVWYAEKYVNGGQPTLYYKRFDYRSTDSIISRYYTDITASYREGSALKGAYKTNLNSAFTFRIPVYKNMPSEICPKPPENSGNNDYYLSSLSVGGHSYNPTFNMYNREYELIVDNNVSQVDIVAKTHNSGAKLSGTGVKKLSVGTNVFKLLVTATSGQTREYTISITRKQGSSGGSETVVKPTIGTTVYKIETYITGIQPETAVNTFKTNLKVSNGSIKIFAASGKEKTSGHIASGDTVKIYNSKNSEIYSYKTVIYGDVNCDGKINAIDISKLQKHILKISTISGISLTSADASGDSRVNAIDISRIQKHILKIKLIIQ